jgi:hypothetical protein
VGIIIDKFMWHTIAASIAATMWVSVVYGVKP